LSYERNSASELTEHEAYTSCARNQKPAILVRGLGALT